ncbi:MAG: non-homologous end-joining DNA ligase [Rhodovibrionaceae bacterium]|nr:non-homologous end-joining DNA ligase [Rhodovibrionaceae bacterium]
MAKDSRTLTLDGHEIEISRADKVFFPDSGITKGDVVDYYARVAETALVHMRERALSMHRFPDGIEGEGFFQKDAPDYFPDWIRTASLPKEGGKVDYVVADSAATLAYIANQGCITPHLGLFRVDRIDEPDRLIFDLDPSGDDFENIRTAAKRLRQVMAELDLPCFLQTTGSRGLHVVVPLDRSAGFDAARDFARRLARLLAGRYPDDLTVEQRKDKRGQRVFLDYLRNAYGQTAVAPYALRAKPGAPVATPIEWEELGDSSLGPRSYTLSNVFRRLGAKDDPWAGMHRHAVSLKAAEKRLQELEAAEKD